MQQLRLPRFLSLIAALGSRRLAESPNATADSEGPTMAQPISPPLKDSSGNFTTRTDLRCTRTTQCP